MKMCPSCNTQNTDQNAFCLKCGQSLSNVETSMLAPASAQSSGQSAFTAKSAIDIGAKYLKKYLKIIIAAVLILVVGIVAFNIFKPAKYDLAKHSASYVSSDSETILLFDDKKPIMVDEQVYPSPNSTQTAFAYKTKDNILWCVQNGDAAPKQIAEDVGSFSFTIDGKSVCYIVGAGDNSSDSSSYYSSSYSRTGDLYVCELGKSPRRIDSDISNFVASSDGKTFAYSKDDSFYINDGKLSSIDISKESTLGFISNGGKYLYYERSDALYVLKNKKESVKLGEDASPVMFNKDFSEVLYTKDSGTYISMNGNPGEKIVGSSVSGSRLSSFGSGIIVPQNIVSFPKTLIGEIISTSNGLYKVGKTQEKTIKLTSYTEGALIASNGKSIIYTTSRNIYRLSNFNKMSDKLTPLNKDTSAYESRIAVSPDLSKIYFCDSSEDLYCIKENGAPKRITSDAKQIYASFDNDTFFIIKDKELYFSKSGSAANKVSGINGDVTSLKVNATHIICETDEAVYRCVSGSSFERLFDK